MDKPHKKLDVWKASMELAKMIYKMTSTFPADERFGLVSQMRRAVISIVSNIAEGAARQGKAEFKNFLSIAQGSLSELDTQLELAKELEYISISQLDEISVTLIRIDKMLTALIRSLAKGLRVA
jgi:four helix bundle protein